MLTASKTTGARARLFLPSIGKITGKSGSSALTGLLDVATPGIVPKCSARLGNSDRRTPLQLATAPSAFMTVECAAGEVLSLESKGTCLNAVMAGAKTINVRTNNVAILVDPERVPLTINVSGATLERAFRPIVVRLSELVAHGDAAKNIQIVGRLGYATPQAGIVITGCGADKVKCSAAGIAGRPSCRAVPKCAASVAAARTAMLGAISSRTPCAL